MKMGVAVMNPLGGGIIPQNAEQFSDAVMEDDHDVIDAALKFVYAHPAVSTVLCGASNPNELLLDIKALGEKDQYSKARQAFVTEHLTPVQGFCTGCGYCAGCPVGIPISQLMGAYNQTILNTGATFFNRSSHELIKFITFFSQLDGKVVFDTEQNPCKNCGRCEKICTQHLPITKRLKEIYEWVRQCGVATSERKRRFGNWSQYKRIGFYTAGFYTAFVIDMYRKLMGAFPFEVEIIDSDTKKRGQLFIGEFVIREADEIPSLNLDAIIITNFIHDKEIYDFLTSKFPNETIQKLHTELDVPWTF